MLTCSAPLGLHRRNNTLCFRLQDFLISAICGLPSHFDTNSNRNRNPLSLCRPSRTGSFLIHTTQNGLWWRKTNGGGGDTLRRVYGRATKISRRATINRRSSSKINYLLTAQFASRRLSTATIQRRNNTLCFRLQDFPDPPIPWALCEEQPTARLTYLQRRATPCC